MSKTQVYDVQQIFESKGVKVHTVKVDSATTIQICDKWRVLSKKALELGVEFLSLFADDIEIDNESWISHVLNEFEEIHRALELPPELFGFGCVALRDLHSPSHPIMPVVHKLHCALNEELFPSSFPRDEADLFLFELYRRWGASRYATDTISHHKGASRFLDRALHQSKPPSPHEPDWKDGILDSAVARISSHLDRKGVRPQRYATVDVITPTFRVDPVFIERICDLRPRAAAADVRFVIIVDDPHADVTWLRALERARPNVRVRVNPRNMGASFTRNVGLDASAAEWILFLDDDVIPNPDVVDEYLSAAAKHFPEHTGFAGFSDLPSEHRVFPVAVHLSQMTYFWRAPRRHRHVPWGITANLFVRRSPVRFDSKYIKTGGGEDIDFCLKLPRQPLVCVPRAAVTHPWWDSGARCYRRFFRWGCSDGILNDAYPHFTHLVAPEAIETALLAGLAAAGWAAWRTWHAASAGGAAAAGLSAAPRHVSRLFPPGSAPGAAAAAAVAAAAALLAVMVACLVADCVMDFPVYFDGSLEPHAKGMLRILATLESTLVKNAYAAGRAWGHVSRGRPWAVCTRFDWFCGLQPGRVAREQARSLRRFAGLLLAVGVALAVLWGPPRAAAGGWRGWLSGEWMVSSA